MPTHKHDRFTAIIEECMGEFLRETALTDGEHVVSVTGVRVNPRETVADVQVSVYPALEESALVKLLSSLTKDAVDYLARHARFRQLPLIRFVPDRGFEAAAHIDELLREGK